MSATDLGNAVVHEGEHIRTASRYVAALREGVYDTSLNLTKYDAEINGYSVTAIYAKRANATFHYNGITITPMMSPEGLRIQLDKFLRKQGITPDRVKCQFMPCD